MVLITYILAVVLFCVAFYLTYILKTVNQIIATSRESVSSITDKNLDDDAKEKLIQAAAIKMLKSSFFLLLKGLVILGVTILPLWLADIAGLADFSETSSYSLRIDVLIITTVVVMAIVFLGRKILGKQ